MQSKKKKQYILRYENYTFNSMYVCVLMINQLMTRRVSLLDTHVSETRQRSRESLAAGFDSDADYRGDSINGVARNCLTRSINRTWNDPFAPTRRDRKTRWARIVEDVFIRGGNVTLSSCFLYIYPLQSNLSQNYFEYVGQNAKGRKKSAMNEGGRLTQIPILPGTRWSHTGEITDA